MNRTAVTSIQYFQTLSRNTFIFSWLKFSIILLIFLGISSIFTYFFQVYLQFYVLIIAIFWGVARFKRLKKLKDLENFKIPDYVWIAFRKRHSNILVSSYSLIEEGFKDYLALHLWHKNSYAMPSRSVDALWHLLLEDYPNFYFLMCQNFLGYQLLHKPHEQEPTVTQKTMHKKQLLNTWGAACHLHDLDPRKAEILPRIFQVDTQVKWEQGLIFNLPFLLTMYAQMYSSASNVVLSTVNSSCSSSTGCSSSSCSGSSDDSNHSSHQDSDTSSSCSSCSSCGGGGD